MDKSIQKPEGLTDNHLLFLDQLRRSAITNMFGATPYLLKAYPDLEDKKAREILAYWMETFCERHK